MLIEAHGSRQIRAQFNAQALIVYQAFSPEIARPAIQAQTFVPPFGMGRMTWIKPSFLWMMYRSAWGSAPGQEHILAVEITREGFEWALGHSCLSHFDPAAHASEQEWREQLAASPVRIQWDPDKDLHLQPLPVRAIQVGLSREAVHRYVSEWIRSIRDVTEDAHHIKGLVDAGRLCEAEERLPKEPVYPLTDDLRRRIGAS
jgi:hypothetical protein